MYHVYVSGGVGYIESIDFSCGRSPGTVTSIGSWYISPAGIHITGTLEGNSYGLSGPRRLRLRCVLCELGWRRQLRQWCRFGFLRVDICSPDFDNLDYSAYHVEMDGSILGNWYVTGSYGNNASPETIDDNDAYYIYTSGVVVLDDYTSNSYGKANSPDTRYITFWWIGLNGVADSWMHNDVAYSYG